MIAPTIYTMPSIVWFTGPQGASVRNEIEITDTEAEIYYMGLVSLKEMIERVNKRYMLPASNTN